MPSSKTTNELLQLDYSALDFGLCMLRDKHALARKSKSIGSAMSPNADQIDQLVTRYEASRALVQRRAGAQYRIDYPEGLPVAQQIDDIRKAVSDNQVVVIAGETGSGKTTQLPKVCLELGLGDKGLIGHTQPRRLAARTVANRICEELGDRKSVV